MSAKGKVRTRRRFSTVSDRGKVLREEFYSDFKNCPIPKEELLQNLGLFLNRPLVQRILWLNSLYEKIVDVHGSAFEFGCRWGQNLALFESFRATYEPYNFTRKIVGFDTFEGFPLAREEDGEARFFQRGSYSVTKGYETYLRRVLDYHEKENPYSHIKKYELVKGDVNQTIGRYLKANPETIIALAYFDLDLYEPTRSCLEAIKPHLTKGSVIGFDELNAHEFPGETLALKSVFGLDRYQIKRSPLNPYGSYIVIS